MRPRSQQNPKSSFRTWGLSAAAIASLTATVAIVAPARAAVLHNWAFDPSTRAFTFTLPDGITPDFFLMAEPARIVLEIPETTLGAVNSDQQYNGAVRSIRLSEVAGGSRVVVELAPNTRLDPRHAELTPTALGNGQTEWILRPLLQDVPAAPVAAAPPAPTTAASAPPAPSPAATIPPETVTAPAAPTATLPPVETTTGEPVEQAEAPADEATQSEVEVPSETAESVEAIADESEESDESMEPAVPIAVTPSPDLTAAPTAATPARSALPDIANSATTGAAQALPTGPDPLADVSTDADVLATQLADSRRDSPPEQLPLDPFAAAQPSVSVPDLADVPDVPAATQSPGATPAASTGVPPNQVRPPGTRPNRQPAAATSPATATAPSASSPPPTAAVTPPPAPEAIAANSFEVPTLPSPPDSWSDRSDPADAPSQARPPAAASPSQTPGVIASPPPSAAAAPSATITSPPPFLSTPPPTATPPSAPVAPPAAPVERATMPPPPTVGREAGTVPFGAPLPTTQSFNNQGSSAVNGLRSVLPPGTRLSLQYVGAAPLVLTEQEPVYEVLVVARDVSDPTTGAVMLPAGTQVIGRFEQVDVSSRRFVAQAISQGGDRQPLVAVSGRIAGVPQPDGVEVALGSGIGAVAMTLLTGFSGIGLLGGAAMGAFGGLAESPALVTIAPGTVIEVEVAADSPPISRPPAVSQRLQ